jgi:hypothetical protein
MNPSESQVKAAKATDIPPTTAKKRRWILWVLGGTASVALLLAISVVFAIWWIQRPITPVVLTSAEKSALEQKLRVFGAPVQPAISKSTVPFSELPPTQSERQSKSSNDRIAEASPKAGTQREPIYQPGSRVLKITERELNGLLNSNTELGQTVRIELGTDAINAYLAVPIPQDFPVGGGKTFRMRGRFKVSLAENHTPYAILEDVTVFGLSLPKDWLGGIKGENLLTDAVGERNGKPIIAGIKNLTVKPGVLVFEVAE